MSILMNLEKYLEDKVHFRRGRRYRRRHYR